MYNNLSHSLVIIPHILLIVAVLHMKTEKVEMELYTLWDGLIGCWRLYKCVLKEGTIIVGNLGERDVTFLL